MVTLERSGNNYDRQVQDIRCLSTDTKPLNTTGGLITSSMPVATSIVFTPQTANTSIYNSDTIVIQNTNSYQPYKTKLLESSSFVGGYSQCFSDVIINDINADIYYGDGTQWIKIRSVS